MNTPVYVLRVFVYEDGKFSDWDYYSGQESASLVDTIHALWRTPYGSDICIDFRYDHDDRPCLHCIRGDNTNAPFPEEWLTKTLTFGHGKTATTHQLVGDQIPITPGQYGLSAWTADVKVRFALY